MKPSSELALMVPEAQIVHRTNSRLRLRIPARQGHGDYFTKVERYLLEDQKFPYVRTNASTGSVLVMAEDLDVEDLVARAKEDGVFALQNSGRPLTPLSQRMVQPLSGLSDSVRKLSKGELDLPALIFIGLLGTGVYQILRGNFGAPPWYTAFWYAFGVFTKSLMDKSLQGLDSPA